MWQKLQYVFATLMLWFFVMKMEIKQNLGDWMNKCLTEIEICWIELKFYIRILKWICRMISN